ncbi:MAG: hypothetical protein US86_C0003G0054 [Candidatus Daviesbacteria bacterium GW2011_GWA2_38_24]|uniref:Uncharacterized protein n=1 Tax=Candidatus Daviesbacteria bacterium GW2011_GWA2_38_24 TaxID=1618422 RepID=A0A0G0MPH9_9BACT|nr:MAG: hypothetical protein US86_C0003G0054 [Candidatus Daviesbacteria bacterium GW2011_GWA2_38_24]KKQ79334.1 MAG: hypothetical protein UT01_C0042G0005 [Candidatus Daviesbacteria bacterium GW2011_GWA1_38_7]OGE24079.1 MAG: hypothetical protein A2688_01330 [Candidatus Daviesbacteria bacterium RIFCSPHIGHO2_01_FULL_38_8]
MQKLAKKFDVLPWVVGGITFLILSLFTMPFFRDKTSYFDPNGLIIGEGGGGFFSPGIAGLSDIVSSENKDLLVGKDVEIVMVPVFKKIDDLTFWVGSDQDKSLLVTLNDEIPFSKEEATDLFGLTPGQLLNIRGVVKKMPDKEAIVWDLTEEERSEVLSNQIYIYVTEVGFIETKEN